MSCDYLDVQYSENIRPTTGYLSLLAAHLASKWDMHAGQTLPVVAPSRAEMSSGFTSLGIEVTSLDTSLEEEHYAI